LENSHPGPVSFTSSGLSTSKRKTQGFKCLSSKPLGTFKLPASRCKRLFIKRCDPKRTNQDNKFIQSLRPLESVTKLRSSTKNTASKQEPSKRSESGAQPPSFYLEDQQKWSRRFENSQDYKVRGASRISGASDFQLGLLGQKPQIDFKGSKLH